MVNESTAKSPRQMVASVLDSGRGFPKTRVSSLRGLVMRRAAFDLVTAPRLAEHDGANSFCHIRPSNISY
jgi:hypothetical protein